MGVINELFLICALSLPPISFTRPPIQASQSIEERLKEWIRKENPDADVFITPQGQTDKLKEYGYERLPFNWNGKEIWIQRKPRKDTKTLDISA